MPPLNQAMIAVILLYIPITLLLLENNLISLHQSSNFVPFPLNHSRLGIMLFSMTVCSFCAITGTGTTDILSMYSVVSSEISSLIFSNPQ